MLNGCGSLFLDKVRLASLTIVDAELEKEERKIINAFKVLDAYVVCVRCETEIFLGDIAGLVDAVRCPNCSVTNLLGDIMGIKSRGFARVARRKGDA